MNQILCQLRDGTVVRSGDYIYSTYHMKADFVESAWFSDGVGYIQFQNMGQARVSDCRRDES